MNIKVLTIAVLARLGSSAKLMFVLALTLGMVTACTPEGEPAAEVEPVRGLITQEIVASEETLVRRYPGVLEPSEITPLSFKVAGKLTTVDLQVGEEVAEGALLAQLDATSYQNTVEERRASLDEARALLEQDQNTLRRQEQLFERNVVSRVAVENAETDVRSRRAQLTQAERSLSTAEEDLADTKLFAPYPGLINAVEAESFQTISAGTTIVSIYQADAFEVSFSVNFATASRLVVGTPATVRLADDPSAAFEATVTELGERADTVSSFPVVVTLLETSDFMKAGMAVEVSLSFSLPEATGFLLPMSAAINEGQIPPHSPGDRVPVDVYVFDPATSTVVRRTVVMGGIRENQLVVVEGLSEGERVATAGVSFLRDGMNVTLVQRGT
ncbi:MAG: efflux RND transporter periplasmic adaptor subunit [Pseudomonadota bacterium]